MSAALVPTMPQDSLPSAGKDGGLAVAHTARKSSFVLLEESQGRRLEQAFGTARFAYNWALAQWEERRTRKEKNNFVSLRNALNDVKEAEFPWMLDVPKDIPI